MPSLESLRDYANRLHQTDSREAALIRASVRAAAVAVEMVPGLDGYDAWLAHLDAMIADAEGDRQSTLGRLSTMPGPDQAIEDYLLRTRIQLAAFDGRLRGLKAARDLIPTLIDRGKSA